MAFRLSCPSCNASFTVRELPSDRRADCPRCGDVFPFRTFIEETDPAASTALPMRPAPAERRTRGRWSVQRTVIIALGMGLVGFVAGFALYYSRGGVRERPQVEAELPPNHAPTAPTRLAGIGYLPADAAIVFTIQPGPALAYAGRQHHDPRELFTRAGIPAPIFDAIASLGLTLPQIDHIAGSTSVSEVRFAMVLVLRRPPADEDEFLKRLKARRENAAKERYSVEFARLPLTLARVFPTVWVFGFDAKQDLAAVDRGGFGAGGQQFAPPLAEMIGQRVPPESAAWVATTDERWGEQPLVKLAIGQLGKPDWLAVLARGRGAMAALALDDPPRLRLFVKLANEPTAEALRAYFARRAAVDDLVRHGGAGEFAFFDTPIDPAKLFDTFQQMLGDTRKK